MFETTLMRAMADERARDGVWSGRVLGEVLRATAAADPDQLAIVDARRRLTYAELDELVESAALGLIDIGVRSGDVVTVQLPNWAEFVVAEFAIERIGAVHQPVAPIFRQHEAAVHVPAGATRGGHRRCRVPGVRLSRHDGRRPIHLPDAAHRDRRGRDGRRRGPVVG